MIDPYGRPILRYTRGDVKIPGSPVGKRGYFEVGNEALPGIENAESRMLPPGIWPAVVARRKKNEAPCIWICWGDIDAPKCDADGKALNLGAGEEHQVHSANYPSQLNGCSAPGLGETNIGVSNSQDAMSVIFSELVKAASYGAWKDDDGAGWSYDNPPFGLVVLVEIREASAPEASPEPPVTKSPILNPIRQWVKRGGVS